MYYGLKENTLPKTKSRTYEKQKMKLKPKYYGTSVNLWGKMLTLKRTPVVGPELSQPAY